jgi:uncharacterized protein (UPF0332 family)
MKPEQGGLLRKAGDSLNAAKLMQQNGYYDFAASRAYYAMFYLAEAFLLEYSLAFSKHSAVIAAFGERFTKTGLVPAELHRYLRDGQDSRNVGDYHFEVRSRQTKPPCKSPAPRDFWRWLASVWVRFRLPGKNPDAPQRYRR